MPIFTKDQVFEAAMELDSAERAEVIERLTNQENARLSPEQELELREALREHRENPGAARSWSDIKAELLTKIWTRQSRLRSCSPRYKRDYRVFGAG